MARALKSTAQASCGMTPDLLPHWQVHDGNGPYLLMVHGFLSSSAQWQLNLAALAEVVRPVTINLFGHAGSPAPSTPDCYHPDYYVRCFEQIREQLGVANWYLLGYSLGAGLTLRYALDHPERVVAHLFTNSTSALADTALLQSWRESLNGTLSAIDADGLRALERLPVHPKHAWRLPKAIRTALLEDAEQHDPQGIAHTLAITNLNATVRERLSENVRPVRLLRGTREKRFQPFSEHAVQTMPQLTVTDIDAGHGLNMEAAAQFNTAVVDFLSERPG